MEMEYGKVFIGGISWDTNEEGLKEYFQAFGEVIEAIIMKDRTTGRARGFGFVVFSDPVVAESVVKEKHMIDGRTVEAKKAVPRDDQQTVNRSSGSGSGSGSVQGSPGPIRTKKIFVGGLASSVTETDFKNYFDQFGMITDAVVMYDHNTQRPRGFGFITFDSEESVDKALLQTFHELNGKMVEVKRAVPKESSPGVNRSPISGFSYGLSRASSLFNYSSPSYGLRMDGRFSPVSVGRSGYPPFSPFSYDMGMGLSSDSVLGINYGGNGSYSSNLGYARMINNSVASSRHADPFAYGLGGGGNGGGNASVLNSANYNMWANGSQNLSNIWGSSNGGQGGGVGGVGYRSNGNSVTSVARAYGVIDDGEVGGDNMFGSGGGGGGSGSGGSGSFYVGPTWRASSPELEVSDLFGYSLGTGASDGIPKNSVGYVGYNVTNRQNRGIAA